MKKTIVLLVVLLLVAGFAIGKGQAEGIEKTKIILVHGYADFYQPMMDQYEAENPQAELVWVPKGGGVVAVDALIAAREKPNVFMSTPGELGKFLLPGFAVELTDEYIEDIGDFKDGALDIYYREGQLLALPVLVSLNAFDINLTLAKEAGIAIPAEVPDAMTTDEFVEFSQAIKALGKEGVYGTAIWAGNRGSQQCNWHWLSAFGGKFYEAGDYSKTVLNSPESVKGLNYIKMLVEEGYAPPEAPVLDDDEGIAFWAAGKMGGLWARAGGWLTMIDNAVKQGMIEERFEHVFMTWPVGPGVEVNPLSYGGAAGMVIDSGDKETNILAAKLLDIMTGAAAQAKTIGPGAGYGTRKSIPALDINPDYDPGGKHYWRISELYDRAGGLDLGYSTTYMSAMGGEWLSVFQDFMTSKVSAEEALATFEEKFNKVLAGE